MSWRHPSDATLGRWSAGGRSRRATRHAEHCQMCLERLEQLTELEPRLRAELETNLASHPSFEQKLWERLEAKLADREALSVFTELMDIGPETTWLLLEGHRKDGTDDE